MTRFYTIRHRASGCRLDPDGNHTQDINEMFTTTMPEHAVELLRALCLSIDEYTIERFTVENVDDLIW